MATTKEAVKEVKPKTVKVKNIWTDPINFESGVIAPNAEGEVSLAEAEALSDYVQKV
jgi:hypothetical protein